MASTVIDLWAAPGCLGGGRPRSLRHRARWPGDGLGDRRRRRTGVIPPPGESRRGCPDPLGSPPVTVYVAEEFSEHESDVLRRYFTNLDSPVFALVNLPEVVKGALFARYSRSPKSLRRLFLDEFVGELDISGDQTIDATVGLRRAEELYDRVFFEYGDDSVAQLGGVHLACEQASNLLTKVLEWGRLMSYLEQSTRYIAYDARIGGRYRFYRDPGSWARRSAPASSGEMDRLFDTYAELLPQLTDFFRSSFPKDEADSDFVYRQADPGQGVRRTARHAARGVALERRHLRHGPGLRGAAPAHALAPAARGANLRRPHAPRAPQGHPVVPQAGRPRRPRCRGERLPRSNRAAMDEVAEQFFPVDEPAGDARSTTTLVDFDPDAEVRMVTAMLYPHTHLPEPRSRRGCGPCRPRTASGGAGLRGRAAATDATAPAARSSASTTASTCSPTTGPSATSSATACSPSSGSRSAPARLHPPGGRGPRRATSAFDRAMERSAALYDLLEAAVPGRGLLRRLPRLQGALLDADERPGGDAPARAAQRPPGPPCLSRSWPRTCTGSSPRRPATTPWPR
jgi:thymidylate synthase ThyX